MLRRCGAVRGGRRRSAVPKPHLVAGGGTEPPGPRGWGHPKPASTLLLRGCRLLGAPTRVSPAAHGRKAVGQRSLCLASQGAFPCGPRSRGWLQCPPWFIHSGRAKPCPVPSPWGSVTRWARTEALPVPAVPGWSCVVGKTELERRKAEKARGEKAYRGVRG